MLRSALLILLVALVFAPSAQAQPAHPAGEEEAVDPRRVAGLSLTYSQAPGVRCGSEPRFREALTARLGYSPFGSPSPDHPPIVLALRRLEVSVTQEKGAVIATITGFSDKGTPLSPPAFGIVDVLPAFGLRAAHRQLGRAFCRRDPVVPPATAQRFARLRVRSAARGSHAPRVCPRAGCFDLPQ